ncbi:MAG: amino acid ABC transporter ATP-binding protein, partial [Clostridia bacterium]|nr:amino acid ABC transporter ATP-binding protein [Clostridia bacterium]
MAVKAKKLYEPKGDVLISVRNLDKTFKETIHAVRNVSTDIHRGEVVVIIGPSGSGKSTFLRCINLLEVPTAGSIIMDGEDIMAKTADINKYRQKVGMVFQHFNLFDNLNVIQNMIIAPTKLKHESDAAASQRAMNLLERVGLADRAEAYPSQLSGGQKQRIAIVR